MTPEAKLTCLFARIGEGATNVPFIGADVICLEYIPRFRECVGRPVQASAFAEQKLVRFVVANQHLHRFCCRSSAYRNKHPVNSRVASTSRFEMFLIMT